MVYPHSAMVMSHEVVTLLCPLLTLVAYSSHIIYTVWSDQAIAAKGHLAVLHVHTKIVVDVEFHPIQIHSIIHFLSHQV